MKKRIFIICSWNYKFSNYIFVRDFTLSDVIRFPHYFYNELPNKIIIKCYLLLNTKKKKLFLKSLKIMKKNKHY